MIAERTPADVLTKHRWAETVLGRGPCCRCGEPWSDQHQLDALAAAGFTLLRTPPQGTIRCVNSEGAVVDAERYAFGRSDTDDIRSRRVPLYRIDFEPARPEAT